MSQRSSEEEKHWHCSASRKGNQITGGLLLSNVSGVHSPYLFYDSICGPRGPIEN